MFVICNIECIKAFAIFFAELLQQNKNIHPHDVSQTHNKTIQRLFQKNYPSFKGRKSLFLIGRIEYQRSSKFKFRIDPKESHTRRS